MSRFRQIAEEAHEESEARARTLRARREAVLAGARRAFDADVALLSQEVLPLLTEAADACSAVGAPPQMKNNFKLEMTRLGAPPAVIEFWCAGPTRPSVKGSAMVTPTGERIELRCYRGALTIGGDSYERTLPIEGNAKPLIEAALGKVLRSYFLNLEAVEAGEQA
ncbi:MAG TPA: hypothetical protein VEZ70_09615 [Allosphingosinicella sp.]|nr:hypothetical protein [Allosphingosinicella sp.]